MRHQILATLLSASALLSFAGEALSHELFLRMDSHYLQPQSRATLKTMNGTFEESAGPVARNRMRDVSIEGGSERLHPDATSWTDVDKQSHLSFVTGAAGTYVAGVSTEYAVSERSAEEFATYLKLEGIPDMLTKYDKSAYPKGVRYRYSKHARAIFQVGDALSAGFSKSLGYPAEITLTTHPAQLKTGDTVSFKTTYNGAPLANQLVSVGHHPQNPAHSSGASHELRTDKEGMARFVITAPAIWYIHLNRMDKSQTPGFDFESDRASLTFQVK